MSAKKIVVKIVDQDATKVWQDQCIVIVTFGNANAQFAFDRSSATVTVGTNNDKTGYSLAADQSGVTVGTVNSVVGDVNINMGQALPTTPTAGTVGQALKDADDNLDATVSSRSTFDPANDTVTVGTNNDKTGYYIAGTKTTLDALNDIAAADVWAVATRTITGGTVDSVVNDVNVNLNQVLPTTPSAGTVGEALKNADTYLDAAVSSRSTFNASTDQVTVGTNNDKTGYSLSATGIDAIHDEVVEGTLTLRQIVRIILSVLAGKSAGGGSSTVVFRDLADTKNRVSATVDTNGNRTSVTVDGS